MLPVVDLCKKSAKEHFFVAGATQVAHSVQNTTSKFQIEILKIERGVAEMPLLFFCRASNYLT